LLDEADVFVGFDELNAALDELFVVVGPVVGEFGDGGRPMPLKPGNLQFTCCNFTSQNNFKGSLS
jgi:hypothetical protein